MTVTSRTPAPAPGAKVATAPPSREQPSDKAPLMWKLAQLLVRGRTEDGVAARYIYLTQIETGWPSS